MKLKNVLLLLAIISFSSFITPDQYVLDTIQKDDHNSKTAIDFMGLYRGILPCADCAGVLTEIQLKPEGKVKVGRRYLSKGKDIVIKEGTYDWDVSGTVITLHLDKELDQYNRYKVGENTLTRLDNTGKLITGDIASFFVLQKVGTTAEIRNTYWQLAELDGKVVPQTTKDLPWFVVFPNNQIIGNSGCNSFVGQYSMDQMEDFRVSIIALTLKACPEAIYETGFMNTFDRAQKYEIKDGMLSLLQEGKPPFAKFLPVYFK